MFLHHLDIVKKLKHKKAREEALETVRTKLNAQKRRNVICILLYIVKNKEINKENWTYLLD